MELGPITNQKLKKIYWKRYQTQPLQFLYAVSDIQSPNSRHAKSYEQEKNTYVTTDDQMWTSVPLPSSLFCFRWEICHLNFFFPIGKALFLSGYFH